MPVDKWGIPFFYPTKTNGFFWEQKGNIKDDSDDGMVRLGKEFDQVDIVSETTGEFKFPFDDNASYFCIQGGAGHFTGGETHGCEGAGYLGNFTLEDNPMQCYIQKQMYHGGSKVEHSSGKTTHSSFNQRIRGNGWIGLAWVRYNKANGAQAGHNTTNSVVLELWANPNPTSNIASWTMVKRVEDTGGWGTGGDSCNGDVDQIIDWSGVQFRFKSGTPDFSLHPDPLPEFEDGDNIHCTGDADMNFDSTSNKGYCKSATFPRDIEIKCLIKQDTQGDGVISLKNLSLREIDPTKSFDDNQNSGNPPDEQPPEPTTVQGSFKLQWNDNTIGASACAGTGTGGGGGTGNSIFYTVPNGGDANAKELSTAFQNRSAIGEIVQSSASIFAGRKPRQIDVWLKKVGTPAASPTVTIKIYNNLGVLVFTSAGLDPSTLTTSFAKYSFDLSGNTYIMQTDASIEVSYNTSSASNYVMATYSTDTYPNTAYFNYEGSWPPDIKTTREWSCDVWE
jgi:hypothetical protein